MQKVVTESDLVIPALIALRKHPKTGLSTSDLQPLLRKRLQPEGDDLELLQGRNDDKFSQKVRNLRAHKRLERDGYATFDNGRFFITAAGEIAINRVAGVDKSLSAQGFSEAEKADALAPSTSLAFVEEGQEALVTKKVRKRSAKLRSLAIKEFSESDGRLFCEVCGFEGSDVYGKGGKGLIEIHHKKPVFLEGHTKMQLKRALGNLSPLCPNCHRMVHRDPNRLLSIDELKAMLQSLAL